jgi:hypothetical protein
MVMASPEFWEYTPARHNDQITAANATQWCQLNLEAPWVQAWPAHPSNSLVPQHLYPPSNFEVCLFILQAYTRQSSLDSLLSAVTTLLVSAAIAADHHQQLFSHHLRRHWFGPVHLHWRPALLKVLELASSWMVLPGVIICFVSTLQSDTFSAANILLNGLAVSFVLALDDELAEFVVSVADRPALEESLARAALTALPVREIQLQPFSRMFFSFVAGQLALGLSLYEECQQVLPTTTWNVFWFCVFGASAVESLITVIVNPQKRSVSQKLLHMATVMAEACATWFCVLSLTFLAIEGAGGNTAEEHASAAQG